MTVGVRPTSLDLGIRPSLCLGLLLLLAPLPSWAGSIVVLKSRGSAAYDAAAAGFKKSYGSGAVVEIQFDGDDPAIAERIERQRPDAVVAIGAKAAVFARERLGRIPLIFCAVQNPERHELVGDRMTGITGDVPPAAAIGTLHSLAPDVRSVAVFHGADSDPRFLKAARSAAAEAGIELVSVAVADLKGFARLARDVAQRVDAFWLPPDPGVAAPESFRFLLELSLARRKPLLAFTDGLVRAGALAAVTPDFAEAGAQAAEMVRRVQAGHRAGDIAPASPRRVRVVVNRATAQALGRKLPTAILSTAEFVR